MTASIATPPHERDADASDQRERPDPTESGASRPHSRPAAARRRRPRRHERRPGADPVQPAGSSTTRTGRAWRPEHGADPGPSPPSWPGPRVDAGRNAGRGSSPGRTASQREGAVAQDPAAPREVPADRRGVRAPRDGLGERRERGAEDRVLRRGPTAAVPQRRGGSRRRRAGRPARTARARSVSAATSGRDPAPAQARSRPPRGPPAGSPPRAPRPTRRPGSRPTARPRRG